MATKTFKVALSLDNPRIVQTGISVQSFDKQSIKIAIELTKNSQTYQIPAGSQIKISLLKLARQEQKIILDVPFTSAEAIEWLVPDYLDGYQGEVRVGVYLIAGTENIDVGYFNITSKVSDIDKAAEEFTDSVMQGWDQIEADLAETRATITQVNTLASEATSKYNAFDASVTQAGQTIDEILALQPQFQSVLDETTGKDVISAPEVILARGGAQTLGERLDSEKAEITAQLAESAKHTFLSKNNLGVELVNKSIINTNSQMVLQDLDENGVIYAYEGQKIMQSADNGVTFTTIHTFAKVVVAVKAIGNGNLLVAIGSNNVGTEVYVGNQSTWRKTLQMAVGSRIVSGWGISIHENIIILCEYGNHGKAFYTYLSDDYGESFEVIFDLSDYAPNPSAAHTHGAAYDKYFDRIWVASGDGYIGGVDNNNLYYSDDRGKNWIATNTPNQLLNMYPLEDRVVFTGDSVPNVLYSYERGDKNEMPVLKPIYKFDDVQTQITLLIDTLYKRDDQSPLLLSFKDESTPDGYFQKVLATYNGKDFFELWTNDQPQISQGDAVAIGPTNDNKILISFSGDGRYSGNTAMLKADINIKKFGFAGQSISDELMNNNNIVDVRDLGVMGNYPFRQTKEFTHALNYCIDNGKTLLIPKGMEILVEGINIKDKSDISIMCFGKVSFSEKESGTKGNLLGFENCDNIRIYEFNTNGLVDIPLGIQILQNVLSFVNCTNIKMDYINAKGISGYLYNFENTRFVEIGETIANGDDVGAGVFRIKNSSDIHYGNLKAKGVGLFGSYSTLLFSVLADGVGMVTERITVDHLEVETASRKLMLLDLLNGGSLRDVKIKDLKASVKSTMTISDAPWISVDNGVDIGINGEIFNPTDKLLDAVDFKRANGLRSNLTIDGFQYGLSVGGSGEVIDASITGIIKNSNLTALRLGVVKDSDFSGLKLIDNALNATTASSNLSNVGVSVWENVMFRDVKFGKGTGDFASCVSAYSTTATNVVFEDCDFSEWSASALGTIFSSGVVGFIRRTNGGVNYRSVKPTGMYSNVGEVVYNSAPTAGGFTGWVCTVAGSPGTWKGFGLIEA